MKEPVTLQQIVDVLIADLVTGCQDTDNITAKELGPAIDKFLTDTEELYPEGIPIEGEQTEGGARSLGASTRDIHSEDSDDRDSEEYDPDDNSKDH